MFADPVPPPPPIEERKFPPPDGLVVPAAPETRAFPRGLSLVAGISNPEWAHAGIGYRLGRFGIGVSVGSIGLAYNLGAVIRLFPRPLPGGPFLEGGATAVQLAETTPGLTPRDIFYQRFLGVGWQFQFGHFLANAGLGWHDPPPRSSAPPAVIVSSGLLPRILLEAGYAF